MTVAADDQRLVTLAELIVREGVNIQPQQSLIIYAPVEARQLVRCVMQAAYDRGAGLGHCVYEDPELLRIAVTSMDPEKLSADPATPSATAVPVNQPDAAQLHIVGPRPRLLEGISTARLLGFHKLFSAQNIVPGDGVVCCTVPFATEDWATWIRPELATSAAQSALWQDIFRLCGIGPGVDGQPEQASLYGRMGRVRDRLNSLHLASLHLVDQATDLTVELLQGASWQGGQQRTRDGIEYRSTLPSGPVQHLLQGSATYGTLSIGQAITIGANRVSDLQLEFRDGRVNRVSASQGADVMEELLHLDDNATRLGQIGLVETMLGAVNLKDGFMAPIMDKACGMHLTLGCPANAKHQPGANRSDIGIDMMFGTSVMMIDGVDRAGSVVPLLRDGRFCLGD